MKLRDLQIGDPVTCQQPVPVFHYAYDRSFEPGLVGFVADIERHRPADIVVNFYCKGWLDGSESLEQTLYGCRLRIGNVHKVSAPQAKAYLWKNAPTREEYIASLIRWYIDDDFQAIQAGTKKPYAQYR